MTQKKINYPIKFTLTIEGIDEYDEALQHVNECFAAFKTAANDLQDATKQLNAIEMKITSE